MNKCWVAAIVIASGWWANGSVAQDLVMGSKAPKLEVAKFIKGEPVKSFAKGKTYVVELWATWCAPCKQMIPHLTELQKQYTDVTFIGVAVLEQDPDDVESFVEKMGKKMDYRVAIDSVPEGMDPDEGATVRNWMAAAEQQGIPTSFIVNGDGLIAWIGHPGEIDEPLEKMSKGKWDLAAEVRKIKEAAAERKKMEAIYAKLRKLIGAFQETGEYDELLKEIDLAISEISDADRLSNLRILKFQVLVNPKGNVDQALKYGAELLEGDFGNEPDNLNNIAWAIVNPDREKKADVKLIKFAVKVALKADELSKLEDPSVADTLAKAYFDNGQLDKAVEIQERVIKLIPGTNLENDPSVSKRLRQYTKALEASKTPAAPK